MENENASLIIKLKFRDKSFEVIADLKFDRLRKGISFIWNKDCRIQNLSHQTVNLKWRYAGELEPPFRKVSNIIEVTSEVEFSELCLEYKGSVNDAWYNVISRDVKALSWYSVWFPQNLPFRLIYDEVNIENGESLVVVKGDYDANQKKWKYGGKGFDPFNIIAYKKTSLFCISNEGINIYALDQQIALQADRVGKVYQDILHFFNGNLFPQKVVQPLDIASTYPAIKFGGGYQREGLLFCDKLGESDEQITWLLAHETAHNWCQGADVNTFEELVK